MMTRRTATLAALLVAATAADARGQFVFVPPARGAWGFDVAAQVVQPVGAFRNEVSLAWGIGFTGRRRIDASGMLALRGDASFLNYGNESRRVPLSPTVNRVLVDMRTSNNIALITLGPELTVDAGAFQPYAHAFVGYSNFFTHSSVSSRHHHDDAFASSTNYSNGGLASGYGGGIRVPLRVRRSAASIDAGARMTSAGIRSYLRPGDITDQADGSLTFAPRTTPTDFWQYHVGVSVSPRRFRR